MRVIEVGAFGEIVGLIGLNVATGLPPAVTVAVAVALLFPVTVSAVVVVALAVFAKLPAVVVWATIVMVALAPAASDPIEHEVVVVPVQVPVDELLETKVRPAGRVSVTVTPVATAPLVFVTVMVNVTLLPAAAEAGATELLTDSTSPVAAGVINDPATA